jgi:phosphate transport system protein
MAREIFRKELEQLQEKLLYLGLMAENAIKESVEALKRRDLEAAHRLVQGDTLINEKRFAIESDTLILIARQQPVAGDLRILAAVLEIATELERIADYAKGIAKITIKMGKEPFVKPLIDIPRMAEKASDMLHRALKAFVDRDIQLARSIPEDDDEMDALYDQIFRELMTYIIADPRIIERANYLMWVAHNLERTADRVLNICERVIFTVTGEMHEFDGEDTGLGPAEQ